MQSRIFTRDAYLFFSFLQKSLRESLQSPEYFLTDFAKFDRPVTLHAGFQALSEFRSQHNRFPRARNVEDATGLIALAKKLGPELDEKVLSELAYQATGDLAPMNAVIGAFVAQEVLKSVSAKFHPMLQNMYFDSLESLPSELPTAQECQPTGSRYDRQVSVFGKVFQEKVANHRQFLVGSGAIGCEMLKNWSMMGLASGSKGVIHVSDLDTIEKSNLNRQFLFRAKDLGKFKSEIAAAAVAEMNSDLKGHIICKQEPVGEATESALSRGSQCCTNANNLFIIRCLHPGLLCGNRWCDKRARQRQSSYVDLLFFRTLLITL